MINAKKSFGQNFLKDQNIINKIINSINISKDDLIIEIGPGMGALTSRLKEKGATLLAFEIDERMKPILSKLEDDRTHIIYKDILSVDLSSELKKYSYNKLFVVANLPYYITTPIVEKLVTLNIINEMTIMVQNEVADRFSATPSSKSYGMMSVLLNLNYDIKKLFVVKNTCFDPVPKVDSAVINMKLKDNPVKLDDYNIFKEFISKCFSQKRKTLKNNLGTELFNKVYEELIKYNYPLTVRAEEIPCDIYVDICNKYIK